MKNKIIIIGEIGINHNGSLKLAKELILMAKLSGCDFVKFQKRSPDITTPEKKKINLEKHPGVLLVILIIKKRLNLMKNNMTKFMNTQKKLK